MSSAEGYLWIQKEDTTGTLWQWGTTGAQNCQCPASSSCTIEYFFKQPLKWDPNAYPGKTTNIILFPSTIGTTFLDYTSFSTNKHVKYLISYSYSIMSLDRSDSLLNTNNNAAAKFLESALTYSSKKGSWQNTDLSSGITTNTVLLSMQTWISLWCTYRPICTICQCRWRGQVMCQGAIGGYVQLPLSLLLCSLWNLSCLNTCFSLFWRSAVMKDSDVACLHTVTAGVPLVS